MAELVIVRLVTTCAFVNRHGIRCYDDATHSVEVVGAARVVGHYCWVHAEMVQRDGSPTFVAHGAKE